MTAPHVSILAIAAASFAAIVSAQQAPAQPSSAEATKMRAVLIFGKDPYYPQDLVRKGVQGMALVRAQAGADGSVEEARIEETSRSPVLDGIALDFVNRSKFKASESGGVFLVPVDFRRDSVTDLPRKPCTDLNSDLDYFRKTFPDRDETEAPVFTMAAGMVIVQLPADRRASFSRIAGDIALQAISACAGDPSRTFFREYMRLAGISSK